MLATEFLHLIRDRLSEQNRLKIESGWQTVDGCSIEFRWRRGKTHHVILRVENAAVTLHHLTGRWDHTTARGSWDVVHVALDDPAILERMTAIFSVLGLNLKLEASHV